MTCCKTSNKGNALPVACTDDDRADQMRWGDSQRFEYGSLETAATDVQQFGEWQEMGADSVFRFEYRHKDEYDDGTGTNDAIVELRVSEDEGTTSEIVARATVAVPNSETDRFFAAVVECLLRKGISYKVVISPSLLTYAGAGQLPGTGDSIYLYSNATLTPTENQP